MVPPAACHAASRDHTVRYLHRIIATLFHLVVQGSRGHTVTGTCSLFEDWLLGHVDILTVIVESLELATVMRSFQY